MKKKCRVIMLPANEESNIQITNNILKYTDKLFCRNIEDIPEIGFINPNQNQYLYFLNDDKICEGDWCVDSTNTIRKCVGIKDNRLLLENIYFLTVLPQSCKKIIASTDLSLNLPKPSDQFLQIYINSFNKKEVIKECLVEYLSQTGDCEGCTRDCIENGCKQPRLKVTKGEITIRLIKDSWNKKELSDVLNLYLETGFISKECGYMNPEEWINQNL